MEHEGDDYIIIGAFGIVNKGLFKGLENLEDKWRPSKLQHC